MTVRETWVLYDEEGNPVSFGTSERDAWAMAAVDTFYCDWESHIDSWVALKLTKGWRCLRVVPAEGHENLLALLKAAREHHRRCLGDMARIDGDPPIPSRDVTEEDFEEWEKIDRARIERCNLGPPLERCKQIETP